MIEGDLKQQEFYHQELMQPPQFFYGISNLPGEQEEFAEMKEVSIKVWDQGEMVPPQPEKKKNQNLQTSFVSEQDHFSQKFQTEEIILLILFIADILVCFYFYNDRQGLVYCQFTFALADVLLLFRLGVRASTLSLIYVIVGTIIATLITPFLTMTRQFMFLPLLYPLGLSGVRAKIRAIGRAVRKQSIWMFLSIALLFYVFGYISYNIFWENTKYFSSPIHSSVSLLQVSTFDGIGEIISRVSAVSGLFSSFTILCSTLTIFQILYNINQALILQYVHEKSININLNNFLIIAVLEVAGVQLSLDARIFKYINLFSTSAVFIIPFQPQLSWLYLTLSGISFVSIVFFELTKGNIFGYRSVFNAALQTMIVIALLLKGYNICFLFCCFRILLISQILNLWKKIRKVLMKVYPMLSLMFVFYTMFVMLIFCLQQESLENTLITGLQMLALDDWSTHIRNYAWYMKIILLCYMLIGNHILLNSLVSQAFNELEDYQDDKSSQSCVSDSLLESLNKLTAEKKFVNILKELGLHDLNKFRGVHIDKRNLHDERSVNWEIQNEDDLRISEEDYEESEIDEPYFNEFQMRKRFQDKYFSGNILNQLNQNEEMVHSEINCRVQTTTEPIKKMMLNRLNSISDSKDIIRASIMYNTAKRGFDKDNLSLVADSDRSKSEIEEEEESLSNKGEEPQRKEDAWRREDKAKNQSR